MYRNILVAIDLDRSTDCDEAISTAFALAERFGAKLTFCSVVSEAHAAITGEWLPISVEQLLINARSRLEGLVAKADHDLNCDVEVAVGTIAGGIIEIAERIGADLIVLVSHQPAARDYLLAANAIRVARRAPCSVLIARHGLA